jgi:tetratricopeptide (TPR) repeat protein
VERNPDGVPEDEPRATRWISMRFQLASLAVLVAGMAHASPDTATSLLDKGRKLESEGKLAAARDALGKARTLAPQDAAVLTELGWVAFLDKDLPVAEVTTREAIAHTTDPALLGAAHYNLGRILEARGDAKAASAAYVASLQAKASQAVVPPVRTNAGAVRDRLVKLDPVAANDIDPLKPVAMAGPFKSLEEAMSAQSAADKVQTECNVKLVGAMHPAPKPFQSISIQRRDCVKQSDLVVVIGDKWYIRSIDVIEMSGHCGGFNLKWAGAAAHRKLVAVSFTAHLDCGHLDAEWRWDEAATIVVGIGPSGRPSVTPTIDTRVRGRGEFDNSIAWHADGTIAITSTGKPPFEYAIDLAGAHALLFP